ncbi:hypothetical protein [Bradyrhizobium sp. McL0616]|uniref:hypothetical protein n=1 Tax=Bradyrhizobium sp. McL0616 TaxID=3415674 RepID=UPI003CF04C80
MRKIILVAAMVLVSASAQAGDRSLSLATANDATTASQTATAATATTQVSEAAPVAEAPKYVDRPPVVSTTAPAATTTTTTTSAPAATQPVPKTTAKADKPKHKRTWTEGRIISELHRHGVYW